MSQQLKIDQATLSPPGVAGKSRSDGKASGQIVTITNTGSGSTTLFQLPVVPTADTTAVSSLAVTGAPKVWTFTPTAGVYGMYIILLIEDQSLPTEYREYRALIIHTPNLLLEAHRKGEYYVEDFGAVTIQLGEDRDQANIPLRVGNVLAIQAALDEALVHGGTVFLAPGVYLTNDKVGYDLTVDQNAPIIIQGLSGFTLIQSNNFNAPVMQFRTTGGNIRDLVVNDIVLLGGREGLALYWCAYSRFNRVWFWGSKNFALQDEFGNGNVFHECRFDESAQGIGAGDADAALFVGCEETLSSCNFGEFSGGIVMSQGVIVIEHSLFHDCKVRRAQYHSYLTGDDIDIDGGLLLTRPASIALSGGYAVVNGCTGAITDRFVVIFRGTELVMTACRIQASSGGVFAGLIDVWPAGVVYPTVDLALNVTDITFQLNSMSGFLIQDLEGSLHDSIVQAQVISSAGGVMTPLATSASSLLNQHFENNNVQVSTFSRFTPELLPAVTAWLRLPYGTITGSGYASVPEKFVNNPATQTVDARRPVNSVVNRLPAMTFSDGSSSSLSWPLTTNNNQTTKTGYGCWVKQPTSGATERIISIGGGTGGASDQKLFFVLDSSQRVIFGLYSSSTGGRAGATSPGAFVANTPFFARCFYDSSLGTEDLRCKIYINGVLQTLTFSDIGIGGVPTTLQTVTGNAIIGNFNNDPSSLQGLNGTIYGNFYCLNADLSSGDEALLMSYQSPL